MVCSPKTAPPITPERLYGREGGANGAQVQVQRAADHPMHQGGRGRSRFDRRDGEADWSSSADVREVADQVRGDETPRFQKAGAGVRREPAAPTSAREADPRECSTP